MNILRNLGIHNGSKNTFHFTHTCKYYFLVYWQFIEKFRHHFWFGACFGILVLCFCLHCKVILYFILYIASIFPNVYVSDVLICLLESQNCPSIIINRCYSFCCYFLWFTSIFQFSLNVSQEGLIWNNKLLYTFIKEYVYMKILHFSSLLTQ